MIEREEKKHDGVNEAVSNKRKEVSYRGGLDPIWILAERNNKVEKIVRHHKCKDARVFSGC